MEKQIIVKKNYNYKDDAMSSHNWYTVHCPKSNPNFRDICTVTWKVVENMILYDMNYSA